MTSLRTRVATSWCPALAFLCFWCACAAHPGEGPDGGGGTGQGGQAEDSGGGSSAGREGSGNSSTGGNAPGAGGSVGTGGMAAAGSGGAAPSGSGGSYTPPADAPPNSPVWRWGQLRVCGGNICDQKGNQIQLKGPSSMWLNWENEGYAESREALRWMRDNWNMTVIRAAVGIEPAGAYLQDPNRMRNKVTRIVQNAIAEGVYVIVDWHDHNAHNHLSQAKSFFNDMSAMFGSKPNLLWEPFNEPLEVSWPNVLKPYHRAIIDTIRPNDPDNIIILGTPRWSQDVEQAVEDPVAGENLMYALHFYSCTHTDFIRRKGSYATDYKLPVFVTEWGATHADGGLDGRLCLEEAQRWHDWMNANKVSWTAWKLDNCTPDSSCILNPGAPVNGGWTDNWLRGHGPFVRDKMKTN